MTETTDKRQIGILTNKILGKYGIDNLQLEIDLATAFHGYLTARFKSQDKAGIRDRVLKSMEIASGKIAKSEMLELRILNATGLYVNDRWYRDGVIDFLIKKDKEGETIEKYAEVCRSNPFTMPKFFKIAEKPSYLKDTWGLAFVGDTDNGQRQRLPEIL